MQRDQRGPVDHSHRLEEREGHGVEGGERGTRGEVDRRAVEGEPPLPVRARRELPAEEAGDDIGAHEPAEGGGDHLDDGVPGRPLHPEDITGRLGDRHAGPEHEGGGDREGAQPSTHRTFIARWISRRSSRSRASARLSCSFLPRARPIRTLARPCLK